MVSGVSYRPLPTANSAGTIPIAIATTATIDNGCRHPKLPPRTSSSNEASTQPAEIATPTATGTSRIPGSGSRIRNDPLPSRAAIHPNPTTRKPARVAQPSRHPRPISTAASTGT